jgi:3-hydroxyisobutyrate dehydrogenase-like beta-hydroxyacid dehydrogenase
MPPRIAFIGFGEAGQTIARGLQSEGVSDIAVYDLLFDDARDEGRLRARAEALGARTGTSHVDAVRGAELVFSAVTAESSFAAAQSCVPGLAAGQLFLDINSVSPQRKRETAALVSPTGALYVDVAVMSAVAPHRHRVPLLVGGPGARRLMPYLKVLNMNAEQVSDTVGEASAVKMIRSIVIKGIEALMLECMLAASTYGVEDRILASLKETYPTLDWPQLSGYLIERIVAHGRRRAAEMREVAATVQDLGLDPIMARATAERQQWLADLAVKRWLGDKPTHDRQVLIAAIRKAMDG